MKTLYEKLIEQLEAMTPQQVEAEWEELKVYNEIGPTVDEYISMIMSMQASASTVTIVSTMSENPMYKETEYCLAA